jgi:EamA domain-containing membrane protein RarD
LDWKIILFGIFSIFNSLLYTYALRKIEITSIGTISYIGPVLFLLIDVFLINTPLSILQILGITFLVLGGVGFAIEGNTRKFKKEISIKILGVFIFWIAYAGTEAYLFKFMNATQDINATTFFANVWAWATIALFVLVLVQKKTNLLFTLSARNYIKNSIIGKSCDVGATLFASQALILASVSQVSAMTALDPLMLFLVTVIIQGVLKIHLNERLDQKNFIWKGGMVILLITGGFLVR